MKYIPFDKLSKLREAARNGDENARKILKMQLDGTEDYSELLENYFAPKPEETEIKEEEKVEVSGVEEKDDPRLEKFLADNGINKDSPDYQTAVEDFYKEVGGKPTEGQETERDEFEEIIKNLMAEESNAIDDYSKAITKVMNMPEFNEKQMKRAIARFEEIRSDEMEHYKELKALLKNDSEEVEEEL